MTSGLLAVLLATLAAFSLAAAVVLAIWSPGNQENAWTAFLSFSGALLALHIPAPRGISGGSP